MPQPIVQVTVDAPPVSRRRANRRFYVLLTLFMAALVIIGFWRYVAALASGRPLTVPRIIHGHALTFAGWMILLFVQVMLISRRRVREHRRLGRLGMAYALLIVMMGSAAAVVAPAVHVSAGEWSREQAAAFVLLPAGDMVLFAALFGAAMIYRRNPDIHKRLIVLATVALLFAPTGRLVDRIGELGAFILWLSPVAIGMVYDLKVRGRVHRAYVIGTALMIVVFARVFVMESEPWLKIGRRIVDSSMRLTTGPTVANTR